MFECCGVCRDPFVPSPTLVRVTCWGCRLHFHERCLHMSEPEVRVFRERRVWWCPPCSQQRATRGLRLEDLPGTTNYCDMAVCVSLPTTSYIILYPSTLYSMPKHAFPCTLRRLMISISCDSVRAMLRHARAPTSSTSTQILTLLGTTDSITLALNCSCELHVSG